MFICSRVFWARLGNCGEATPNGKTLVVLALTALAEKNADAIRKVSACDEDAPLEPPIPQNY
eukprot:6062169-Amphidinium_carterae.1